MKTLLASFQQTSPRPDDNLPPAGRALPPARPLIFGMACRILGRAHGNVSAVAATEYGLNTTVQILEYAKAEREWLSKHYWARPIEARSAKA